MSLGKFARLSSVFVVALIFGLGWVGLFRFLERRFETPIPKASPLHSKTVGQVDAEGDRPVISMDDKIFTPPQVDENDPEAFDPEGLYTISKVSDPGFEDIDSFVIENKNLEVDCDHADFGRLIKPYGQINFKAPSSVNEIESQLNLQNLKINDGSLSFTTDSESGVNYVFDGEFKVKGNFYTLDPGKTVLSGIIEKFVNGKKVAEARASFTWSIDLTCVC